MSRKHKKKHVKNEIFKEQELLSAEDEALWREYVQGHRGEGVSSILLEEKEAGHLEGRRSGRQPNASRWAQPPKEGAPDTIKNEPDEQKHIVSVEDEGLWQEYTKNLSRNSYSERLLEEKEAGHREGGKGIPPARRVEPKARRGRAARLEEVDLHGLTLEESKRRLESAVNELVVKKVGEVEMRVITGKGLHSGPSGGVLSKEVHGFFVKRFSRYILSVDASPHSASIEGVPLRGFFVVRMKF